jgi:acetyl esterase/lipase
MAADLLVRRKMSAVHRCLWITLAIMLLSALPAWAGHIEKKDIIYDVVTETDGAGILRREALKLDLYLPKLKTGRAPLLLYIHGGCYVRGSRARIPSFIKALSDQGIAVASVDYRLALDPANATASAQNWPYPAGLTDVQQALRFLRKNKDIYLIDPARIAAHGESAGGQLAAALGVRPVTDRQGRSDAYSARIDIVSDWYGRVDFTQPSPAGSEPCAEYWLGQTQTASNTSMFEQAGILPYVDKSSARRFQVIHGSRDTQVAPTQSAMLAEKLRAAGIPARLYLNEGWPHGFSGSLLAEAVTRRFLTGALGTATAEEPVLSRLQIDSGKPDANGPLALPASFVTDRHADPKAKGSVIAAGCSGQPIAKAKYPSLYWDVRYGRKFGYKIPVENGVYRIRLHFAECHYTRIGQRVFDVNLFGLPMLRGYDILKATKGRQATADVQELDVIVRNGLIDLSFSSVSNISATIAAIEIERTL